MLSLIFSTGYLNLNYNQLSGSLPSTIRMNEMFYFDLSHNALTGKLPTSVNMIVLKHFHLDHNRFTGSIPNSYPRMGNSRFFEFFVNDNQLTGTFPRGPWHKRFPHKFLSTWPSCSVYSVRLARLPLTFFSLLWSKPMSIFPTTISEGVSLAVCAS